MFKLVSTCLLCCSNWIIFLSSLTCEKMNNILWNCLFLWTVRFVDNIHSIFSMFVCLYRPFWCYISNNALMFLMQYCRSLTHTILYDARRRWKNETWMNIKMITGFNLNHGVFSGELAQVLCVSQFPQQCDWEFHYSGVWHWYAGKVAPYILKALFSHEVLGSTASNTAPHARSRILH